MSDGSSTRRARQSQPRLERLEGRALLSGVAAAQVTPTPRPAPGVVRRFEYATPDGGRAVLQLFGVGDLAGTFVDAAGALNVRLSGTNEATGLIAHVHGGSGRAPLRSIAYRNVSPDTLSGVGGSAIDVVNLKDFDLVPGGRINLTAGVHILFLNSTAADTQVELRELPVGLLPTLPPDPNHAGPAATVVPAGTTGTATPGGFGGGGATPSAAGTAGAFTATENGVTVTYVSNAGLARTLTGVSGVLVPGVNLHVNNITPANPNSPPPGPPPAPPGVIVSIDHVNGPARRSISIGNPNVFAYDKDTGQLVRFDTTTGAPTLTIPDALHGNTAEAGVALARSGGRLVVLVSDGSTVYAYDALSGDPAGFFSVKVPGIVLPNPTRLGTYDTFTVVGDPTAGPDKLGRLQAIDVTASLADPNHKAVPLTEPATGNPVLFTSQRAFQLTGGLAGLPGSGTLFAAGAGHFDPFNPDQWQLGVAALGSGVPTATGTGAALRETTRGQLTGNTPGTVVVGNPGPGTIITDSHGVTAPNQGPNLPAGNPNDALGNIDLTLALDNGKVTDAATGTTVNRVSLYNPSSLARVGVVNLKTADTLTGLSGSFRPDLRGVALVDVQGQIQSFRAMDARGLVLNGGGNVNLVKIHNAADTTVVGLPMGHAQIPVRTDVTIFSSGARVVSTRNGVTLVPNLAPTGPLSLP